jgi:hypothetical protein
MTDPPGYEPGTLEAAWSEYRDADRLHNTPTNGQHSGLAIDAASAKAHTWPRPRSYAPATRRP